MKNPVPFKLVPTTDSDSFLLMGDDETGLPLFPHVGSFGVRRRYHTHEGVDLYVPEGTPVRAMEGGKVTAVIPFTGEIAGLPHWHNTYAVFVEGDYNILYGEIEPTVSVGDVLEEGDIIGHVTRVLKNDKGRPTSMLHIELHEKGITEASEWLEERPYGLLDPTQLLLATIE